MGSVWDRILSAGDKAAEAGRQLDSHTSDCHIICVLLMCVKLKVGEEEEKKDRVRQAIRLPYNYSAGAECEM